MITSRANTSSLALDEGDAGVGRGLAGDGDAALAQGPALALQVDDAADLKDDGAAAPECRAQPLRLPGPSLASVVTRTMRPPAPPVVCAQPGVTKVAGCRGPRAS